ncbi:hypothetical protein PVAP13_6KG399850 [Panicum virgatum]|uniref:Uncharacterized protein n=2 Tax=Panicum virgatum TaxID=38727 RepID=A0A8T0RKE9_PANVG|nr:hypothetical protein PVAP13_6KG399850 [Panicum virgatum]
MWSFLGLSLRIDLYIFFLRKPSKQGLRSVFRPQYPRHALGLLGEPSIQPKPKISRRHQRHSGTKRSEAAAPAARGKMLKFLSKVVVEYCPLDPRKAAAVELLAQCNGRKAKDSNPACSVELRRLPAPPASADPKPQPPRVLVTYLNGAEEAVVAAEGATAQGIRDQILARGRLIDTEQMFRDGGETWPVVIPEEELGMSFPGIKPRKAEDKPQA